MEASMNWLLRLLPGAIAILGIGGAGFYVGAKVRQSEVARLEAQLAQYRALGDRINDLRTSVEAGYKNRNRELVEAYAREMADMRSQFGDARSSLREATEELKRRGRVVDSSTGELAATIRKLPVGSAERERMISDALETLTVQAKRQQLCTVTPIADTQLLKLKTSFSIGSK
jgi:methyl-accepting chemotaxis protein